MAATPTSMSYEEFLIVYFWVTWNQWSKSWDVQEVLYTNVKNSKVYSILQDAIANGAFPNLAIELPLKREALESDLAQLVKYNYWETLLYTKNKSLSFDYLANQLKKLAMTLSKSSYSTVDLSQYTPEDIADAVYSLLKYNYIHNEKLENLQVPQYSELTEFVNWLWDDFTEYYDSKEWIKFMETLNGEFAGLGVYLLQQQDEAPFVMEVIKWSPAEKKWFKIWDQLIAIDGRDFSDYDSVDDFIDALKGEVGSSAVITVNRDNEILEIEVTRDIVQIPLTESLKKWWVCYLRINSFDIWSKNKVLDSLNSLGSCSNYVFDLRSNPWWVIDEVVGILDEFLPEGKTIMTVNGVRSSEIIRSEWMQTVNLSTPSAILIDWGTASAAEIFAWVLKYYYPNEVKLVWVKSYWKGSVQQVVQFPDSSIIKYTVALWNIADEKTSINGIGLFPDIEVEDNVLTIEDEVLEKLGFFN